MKQEIKTCQNCKNQFTIEPEDFVFYGKIGVPAPTFCPECRAIRRMTWRNERALYHRKDAFQQDLISIYAPETNVVVYDRDYWWSDKWNPTDSGRDYDFSKPFFTQFHELHSTVPLASVFTSIATNSPYTNFAGRTTDCHLIFASWECERCLYGEKFIRTKDSMDCYHSVDNELCYQVIDCENSHKLFFSQDCNGCIDSAFLYDCKNCTNCFGCTGLRNKEYHLFNQPYSREKYIEKIKEYSLGSFSTLKKIKDEFKKLCLPKPHRFGQLVNTTNVIGDHCSNAQDCYACFDFKDGQNLKYCVNGLELKDSYDGYGVGGIMELLYEGIDAGVNGFKERFGITVYNSQDTDYCINCDGSSDLFGCIGLRKKQYCILNKQYTKAEYEALRPKIIKHMNTMPYTDKKGIIYKYGEFFPAELSPFAYNETIAQEYFPLTEEVARANGYAWRLPETKSYASLKAAADLPDNTADTDDSILKETIGCVHAGTCNEQCTTAFKIIPTELAFYKKFNLALPRLCPNCRNYERVKARNPNKLWHRTCQCTGTAVLHPHGSTKCPNSFETTYAPERPEIVYCEQCYNAEVG